MNEVWVFRLIGLFRGLYERAGVDYLKMVEILRLKLLMDRRRVNTAFNQADHSKQRNYFFWNVLTLFFMGIISGMVLVYPFPFFVSTNLFFSMILILLLSMFISDYSTVLLDIKEKDIYYSKPLDGKTVNAAKITHIFLYIASYGLALALPGIALSIYHVGGLFGLLLVGMIILLVGFTVFLAGGLYFLLLKIFSGEKLKDILNGFQIAVSVIMIVGYQILPRLIGVGKSIHIQESKWLYLLPSSWFAAPFALFFDGNHSPFLWTLTGLGICLPVLLMIAYFTKITPYFEDHLYKLSVLDDRRERLSKFWQGLIRITGKNSQDKAFMSFILINLQRDRNLKLRILPQLAFAVVMPVIFLWNSGMSDPAGFFANIQNHRWYMNMYISSLLLCAIYTYLTLSDYYKAAGIYQYLPINDPEQIYFSAYKIAILKYILPLNLLIGTGFLLLYRATIWVEILTIIINSVLAFLWVSSIGKRELPLSMPFTAAKSGSLVRMFQTLPFLGGVVGFHFWSNSIGLSKWFVLGISVVFLLVSWLILLKICIREKSNGIIERKTS